MIIVKVKHETGLDSDFVDIIVSDDKLHLLFLLNMLEKNNLVVWYEVMRSSRTSFDIITNLKDEFGFSNAFFSKLKSNKTPQILHEGFNSCGEISKTGD